MPHRHQQPDLLDWQPPQPVAAFDPSSVQASSLPGKLARAIALALRECELPREEVAARMSVFLGRKVSKNMVDAYASQGREDHGISAERFVALIHATGDRRLLELLAEPFGWTVIERHYLTLIDLAAVRHQQDELQARESALRRDARRRGLL